MNRFYCPSQRLDNPPQAADAAKSDVLSDGHEIPLPTDEAHHALRVLRLRDGDDVELFDGHGGVARGTLVIRGRAASVRLERTWREPVLRPTIDVAVALPKGPRADAMVAALSQAGVRTMMPLRVERTIVEPRDAKLDRFNRAAVESAKQCGRAHVMVVSTTRSLDEVLAEPHDLRLLTDPRGKSAVDAAALRAAEHVLILIGPEGGWTEAECDAADRAGCMRWSIGPHVMRVETAAPAAAAIARYLAGPEAL
mgnify:CR=1 FL=1